MPYVEVLAYGVAAVVPGVRSQGRGGVPRAAAAAVASPPVPSTAPPRQRKAARESMPKGGKGRAMCRYAQVDARVPGWLAVWGCGLSHGAGVPEAAAGVGAEGAAAFTSHGLAGDGRPARVHQPPHERNAQGRAGRLMVA